MRERDGRLLVADGLGVHASLAKDALNPGIGILEISASVAVHGQHFLPVEDVVAEPVLGEIGILDRPQADNFGDPGPRLRIQVGAVVIDYFAGLGNGFVKKRLEADHVSLPGLEWTTIGAPNRAKG